MSQTDSAPINFVRYKIAGVEKIARGRVGWLLAELLAAGDKGLTPLDNGMVGRRLSEYVRRNRNSGIDIETIREPHGGYWASRHGRYVLRSKIEVIELKTAAENAEAAQ